MSLLAVFITPHGFVFGADRNVSDGLRKTVEQRAKIVQSKDGKVLAGYVGNATVNGQPTDRWLDEFLERHAGESIEDIGPALAAELETEYVGVSVADRGTILHVAGFVGDGDDATPLVWYVRDAEIQTDGSVAHLPAFEARAETREIGNGGPPYFASATGPEIKAQLSAPDQLIWASFRQGWDIRVFGPLDQLIWSVSRSLVGGLAKERVHTAPTSIAEWEPFVKFSLLAYCAYFQAFYPPDEQVVGGGIDVLSLAWPQ